MAVGTYLEDLVGLELGLRQDLVHQLVELDEGEGVPAQHLCSVVLILRGFYSHSISLIDPGLVREKCVEKIGERMQNLETEQILGAIKKFYFLFEKLHKILKLNQETLKVP